jgi:hypothetical protein
VGNQLVWASVFSAIGANVATNDANPKTSKSVANVGRCRRQRTIAVHTSVKIHVVGSPSEPLTSSGAPLSEGSRRALVGHVLAMDVGGDPVDSTPAACSCQTCGMLVSERSASDEMSATVGIGCSAELERE